MFSESASVGTMPINPTLVLRDALLCPSALWIDDLWLHVLARRGGQTNALVVTSYVSRRPGWAPGLTRRNDILHSVSAAQTTHIDRSFLVYTLVKIDIRYFTTTIMRFVISSHRKYVEFRLSLSTRSYKLCNMLRPMTAYTSDSSACRNDPSSDRIHRRNSMVDVYHDDVGRLVSSPIGLH